MIRKNIHMQIYTFLLIGIMPLLSSPWRNEVFYDIKIIFTAFITIPFFMVTLKNNRLNITFIDKLLLGYGLLLILSTIFSIDKKVSLLGLPDNREGLVSLLLYLMIFYIFYKNFRWSERTMESILIIASILSIFGILQYYEVLPEITSFGGQETKLNLITIGNRNFVGTYCTLLLPFALCGFIKEGKKHFFIYSLLIYGLLLASITRSGWLAFGVYFFIMFWFIVKHKKQRNRYMIIFMVFISLFVVMNRTSPSKQIIAKRAESIVHDAQHITEDTSGSSRIHIWKNIFPLVTHRPLLGGGPDSFKSMYEKYPYKLDLVFYKAHNEYLQMAVTLGIPIVLLYLGIIYIALRNSYKALNNNTWRLAHILAITGYLVQALFNVSVISTAPIFWAFLGIGAGLESVSHRFTYSSAPYKTKTPHRM